MTVNPRLSAALADRYRIERELGAGGMATVYLAHDLKHDRDVALKVLRPELAAVLGSDRFLNEVLITSRLQHPHIVTLIDSGETGGFLWYVLPYIRGESLRDRLTREKQLGVEEALAITRQVASALDYAHQQGVIHRDIKPENILLHEGEAMLADFGIALAVKEAGGNRLTETGLSLGTPQYMSPEQATGDRTLDARSDIYSLAAVLYEMLSGEPPHTGATAQVVIAKLMTERPTRLRNVRDTVPEGVDSAVAKALAKVPGDRFGGAAEFARALAAQSPEAPPRRRKMAVVLVATALLVIAAAALVFRASTRAQDIPAADRRQLTFSGHAIAPLVSPDGMFIAYTERRKCGGDTNCPDAFVIQESGENGARRVLASISNSWVTSWSPDGRQLLMGTDEVQRVTFATISVLNGEVRTLGSNPVAWGVSADTIFSWSLGSEGQRLWIRTLRSVDGMPVDSFQFGPTHFVNDVLVSPNGRWLAIRHQRAGGAHESVTLLDRHGALVDSLSQSNGMIGWDRSSAGLYLTEQNGDKANLLLQRINPRTGRIAGKPEVVMDFPGSPWGISVAGSSLAYGETGPPQNEVWTLRRPNGTSTHYRATRVYETTAQIWAWLSRDGRQVFLERTQGSGDSLYHQTYTMPFEGGTLSAWGTPRYWHAMSSERSIDDSMAVIAERRDGRTRISIVDPRSHMVRELGPAPTDSGAIWWLGDGRFLWHPSSHSELIVLDSLGRVEKRWSRADSLGFASIYPAPDGSAVSIFQWDIVGDNITERLVRMSLSDGVIVPLWTRKSQEKLHGQQWTRDGWIHLLVRNPGGSPPRMMRISATGGPMVDEGPIPVAGDWIWNVWYSDDGLRAVVYMQNRTSDVVLVRNFDRRGNQ